MRDVPLVITFAYAFLMPLGLGVAANWDKLSKIAEWPSSATVAAWVQAIGSIGAILGAIWISSEQQRQAVAREKQKQVEALMALSEASATCAMRVGEIYQIFVKQDLFGSARRLERLKSAVRAVRDVERALASFDIADLPGATGIVPNIFSLRRMANDAAAEVERIGIGSLVQAESLRRLRTDTLACARGISDAVEQVKRGIKEHR